MAKKDKQKFTDKRQSVWWYYEFNLPEFHVVEFFITVACVIDILLSFCTAFKWFKGMLNFLLARKAAEDLNEQVSKTWNQYTLIWMLNQIEEFFRRDLRCIKPLDALLIGLK